MSWMDVPDGLDAKHVIRPGQINRVQPQVDPRMWAIQDALMKTLGLVHEMQRQSFAEGRHGYAGEYG